MADFDNSLLFKCIVEQGSMVKAAEVFAINASAVSKRLHKLEQSLGVQLLKRTTRQLVLTDAGHYFYEKITRLQHDWVAAKEGTSSLGGDIKGTLRIATPQPIASRFLMPVLARFRSLYPALQLDIIHKQIHQLPCLDADVSISRRLDYYDSNTMLVKSFFQYTNGLFAAPSYLRHHEPINVLADIKQHCCLIYHDDKQWTFENEAVTLQNVIRTNNAEIMISAAKQGMGIIYLPSVIVGEELQQGSLVPILPSLRSHQFKTNLYYLKAEFVPQKIRVLIDFLSTEFAKGNL